MTEERKVPSVVAALLAVAALFAGWTLVGGPPGIAFPLTAIVIAAVVVFADPDLLNERWTMTFGAIALSLSTMAALRTAEWVVALNLLLCIGYGCFAVGAVATWAQAARTIGAYVLRSLSAPFRLLQPLFEKVGSQNKERVAATARGLGIAAVLLVVFGILFATADPAFAQMAENLFAPDLNYDVLPARVFVAFTAFALGGALVLSTPRFAGATDGGGDPFAPPAARERVPQWVREWIIPLALLDLLFIVFVAIQFTVLFGGRIHVLETTGLTYAQYARSGFFQLLTVAFLTMGVVVLAIRRVDRGNAQQRLLARILLGTLCACTLVILVSAMKRLSLYEDVYGFTRLRLSVHVTIIWLAVVFGLIVVSGIRMHTKWLPRAVLAVTGVGVMVFSLASPDALVAKWNVERFEATGKIDLPYLEELSPDALPALTTLPAEQLEGIVDTYEYKLSFHEPWSSANLARARAHDALQEVSMIVGDAECNFPR